MTTASEFQPTPTMFGDTVHVRLAEIQRIRDELARIRHYHRMIARLFEQVSGLHQTLAKQLLPATYPEVVSGLASPPKE